MENTTPGAERRDPVPDDPGRTDPGRPAGPGAGTDELTGLPDRSAIVRELTLGLARTSSGRPLTVIAVALGTLARVPSARRHVLHDDVVRDVALRLVSLLADRGAVGRTAGDEFLVVLPDTDARAARRLTAEIDEVLHRPMRSDGLPVPLVAWQGATVVEAGGRTPVDVLGDAATALVRARADGGPATATRVAFLDDADRRELRHRTELAAGLQRALGTDELHLSYQPIVELGTGRAVSAEALARWLRPHLGFVPPEQFVGVAEEFGLMTELGSWVLDAAVAQVAAWDRGGRVLPVTVNVSSHQLTPGFPDEVAGVLRRHGVPPGRLVLEVPEPVVLDDPDGAVAALQGLRSMGCRVALDDFGAGGASLGLLERLPVNVVKIDRALVAGVADPNGTSGHVIRAVLGLAEELGLLVVAEGVETEVQSERLQAHGCLFGQGFLFSPPRDPTAMSMYLDRSADPAEAFATAQVQRQGRPPTRP